ncbi:hypothetical protein [Scytonema sp. NUACC26]|uniref:hypothetical protein n=1 Tax=Scytonema sp. NUACC26 TaxID=3140176 RepID=UPI0038B2858C
MRLNYSIAIVALFRHRLFSFDAMLAGINVLRQLHTGHVGDYVTWLVLGFSTFGILLGMLF